MSLPRPLIAPFVLSFCLLFPAVLSTGPLFHKCFNQANYTANSPFASNLKALADLLYAKAPPTGFGLGSAGQGRDQVNGLALCRGDASSSTCKACVREASKEIRERCPRKKGAIIWYDNCLYKYSDSYFFGEIDTANKFYMFNTQDVKDPKYFNRKTKDLLSGLVDKAGNTTLLYATGEMELKKSMKLYGLVQCTRDLSANDCKKCLDDAIAELPDCCDGKEGGRVVGGSCNFRYEIYPFVNA
ncbi:cysteine-rich repeat secretory protein 38-like [Diospyros lotus]|uniref:cysteine-rich repeat secretory protein 38-like n=1 Tax=Diospyros lotus TaxID=55363 RepID=UPI0022564D89|nr:cysteine-rich repeat secretory protein 38-like [Diospyros lotus]